MTNSTVLWYASRATGIVALVLLTATFVLGILVNRQGRLPGLPRFAITDLHRNLSLIAVVFTAVHIVSAVLDSYVSIPVLSAVVPFTSGYERLWLGLGAIALDLMLAMIITSLVRGRLNPVLWRVIHFAAYLSWPVAWVHSIWASKDLQHGPLLFLGIACAAVMIIAVAWRVAGAARQVPRAARVATQLSNHTSRPQRVSR
jgi:methionine sulfoxide reductase heme-binding subunit